MISALVKKKKDQYLLILFVTNVNQSIDKIISANQNQVSPGYKMTWLLIGILTEILFLTLPDITLQGLCVTQQNQVHNMKLRMQIIQNHNLLSS